MGYGSQGALSGAGKGAAYGTMIMPGWGTAIGAVVGGLAGWIGGRGKSKKEKAERALQQKMIDENRTALGKKRAQAVNILTALRQATNQGGGDYVSYLNMDDVPAEHLGRAGEEDANWSQGLMEGVQAYANSPASSPSTWKGGGLVGKGGGGGYSGASDFSGYIKDPLGEGRSSPAVSWGDSGLGSGDFSAFANDPLGKKKAPNYFGLG